MKNQKQTIRKIVGFLNNPDEDGGFWLPNIQRPFVWTEEQICRLFDSILREYPISTLLVWKTTSKIRRRKFIDNWKHSLRLSDFYATEDEQKKCLVLDGQQRLQSLFIGLKGSFEGRELHLDILSGDVAAPDDIKYRFKFLEAAKAKFPWIRFRDLMFTTKKQRQLSAEIGENAGRELGEEEADKIGDHLNLIDRTFKMDEAVVYQELDSIDNPKLYTEDDVVEIFIRANSGGTILGKSDLLFSLLSVKWNFANEKMEELLESLNRHGFAFDRDFVLKTCLVVFGQGARYEVDKFRKAGVREDIEGNWDRVSESIQDVLDYLREKTFIRCDRAIPSYLVLIPLVYLRYHYKEAWRAAQKVDDYVVRCLLTGAFGGQPDNLIDALTKTIAESSHFDVKAAFAAIRSQQRSLELTEDRFWQMGYGSKTIHLLFNLWYRDFNQTPAYDNNMPQIDHIFPQSALKKLKVINPETGRSVMKYTSDVRDQLANCMLLSREENGSGGKWATLPKEWFSSKDSDYLRKHLIPADPKLWEMDQFEEFIEERKKLIADRFKWLLATSAVTSPD
ncbi:MAG: DUF262 domain-containing protein [Planctomycetes bacterium]|nr:DUF262 domain-containing protein [Planctomycetota bacterium]